MAIAFDQSVTQNLGEVIGREWLETNGLGGWASSTIANIHTRRYHGLLVAATQPPVGRVVLLSKLDETLMRGDVRRELGSNVYPGAVHPHLLTSVGLRSLAPHDPAFNPTYQGNAYQRDAAYHQGTVWAWLLGPYLTALVKVRGKTGRKQGLKWMPAVQDHLSTSGIGQISEIFDGDPPHAPRGCMAQAWSVAEIARAYVEDLLGAGPSDED